MMQYSKYCIMMVLKICCRVQAVHIFCVEQLQPMNVEERHYSHVDMMQTSFLRNERTKNVICALHHVHIIFKCLLFIFMTEELQRY